ncbi:MAG: lipocalin-like domain-containing protein, partial [Alphaproteobacteria bacterium]|nr:lipocalin-like domain-containing protein [Alphaproteobacteria bacterium]
MALVTDDLLGAWQLAEMYTEKADGFRAWPMGWDAGGAILYTADGIMSATVVAGGRTAPGPNGDAAAKAAAYASYFNYNYVARWRLDGDTVVHTLVHTLDPAMVGMELRRAVEHRGDIMFFRGASPDGTASVIVWRRGPGTGR